MSKQGLAQWIAAVVPLHARAKAGLRVDVVHDLRVAIRRCRSLAQGLRQVDDDDGAARWKALSDVGRPLFQGLGDLRDAQVMQEHTQAVLAGDLALAAVSRAIDARIRATKEHARAAVVAFDVPAWRAAGRELPVRATALLEERALFDHLALRRFHEARELHQQAMRSKSSVALHALRIGVKKLRYCVEMFLPDAHAAVGKSLKRMQEILGDVHDLDVLLAFLASEHVQLHSDDRSRVCSAVRAARDARVAGYRELVVEGVWQAVRAALADGAAAVLAHLALFAKRASTRVDPAEARALERSALSLLRAFRPQLGALKDARAPGLLRWACACALVADVDEGGARVKHLKQAHVKHAHVKHADRAVREFVRALPVATGFSERERELLEVVARAARGACPALADESVQALAARDRKLAAGACALLHFAVGLTGAAPFVVRRGRDVTVVETSRPLVDARDFAARRGPLEALLGAPLWFRAPAHEPASAPARAPAPDGASAARGEPTRALASARSAARSSG